MPQSRFAVSPRTQIPKGFPQGIVPCPLIITQLKLGVGVGREQETVSISNGFNAFSGETIETVLCLAGPPDTQLKLGVNEKGRPPQPAWFVAGRNQSLPLILGAGL